MRKGFLTLLATACLAVLVIGTAKAQPPRDETHGDFRFIIAPYAWLTALNGTIGAKGHDTQVNVPFADIFQHLDMAAMVHAEVIYQNRFGFFSDFNYSLLGAQASGDRVSLDGKSTLILTDIVGYYRIGDIPLGKNKTSSMNFDFLAGARIWSLGLQLDLDRQRGGREVYDQRTWADPILGLRSEFLITDSWLVTLRGGLGGFSVGSSLTWDATATVGYTFWEHGTLLVGYRAVGANYSTGSGRDAFKFNATLSGPIIGLALAF